jgi:hypothetical protein
MATSGSKSVTVTSWDTLKFSWSEKSQSVANNTTTISWKLELIATSSGYISSSASKSWSVTVNGTKYSGTNTVGISNNSTKTLASGTTTIAHNDDGTKTFNYSFSQQFDITFNSWIGTISGSGSGTLDIIARASQPSCVTWPEHTQNVGSFGDTISIHMNRKSSSFTHTVRYQFGSQSGTIATGVTTGTTWTIPKSLMNLIPNTTSGSGTIYADTYNGSTLVGTKYCGFTATVPTTADCSPTCSITLDDTAGWDDVYGSPVQGLSKIKVTVKPTLAYSSPIDSYSISVDGDKYNTATATTGALKKAGSSVVSVTIKDKRGRTGSASYTMNVQAYALPNISKLTAHRCDADGTENEQGEYIRVLFSAAITSLGSTNTAAYTVRYKQSTATSYTSATLSTLANKYAVTDHAYIFAATSNASYDVEVTAKDRHGTATRATSASTAFTLMNWGADGTSMGIGKVAEKANTVQIALDVEFLGAVKGAIFDAVYPVGSIYCAYNHTNPGTLFGGTWTRLSGGFLWASLAGDTIGQTGGEKTVTLTANQIPAHNHGSTYTNAGTATKTHAWLASGGSSMAYDTVNTGGGQAHNNMPPYIQVSIWRRTA